MEPVPIIKKRRAGIRPTLPAVSRFLIWLVILTGVLVLAGWQFDISHLKRPIPKLVAMNPTTAICFILTGLSFLLITTGTGSQRKKATGYTMAGLVLLTASLKIAGNFIPSFPPIDQFLFYGRILKDSPGNLSNRMADNTALAFIFSSISLLLLNYETRKKRRPAHFFALLIFIIGFSSSLAYLYQTPEFLDLLSFLPMAAHTAFCFLLVSIAIFLVYPDKGISKEFTGSLTGAFVGRIFIVTAILAPIVLGELRLYAYWSGEISAQLGTTLLVLSIIIVFCGLLFHSVILLNRKDRLRKEAEEKLRQSEVTFRSLVTSVKDYAIFMLDPRGNVLTWNEGAQSIKGYSAEEIKGRNISTFYTTEDRERNLNQYMLEMAEKNGRFEQEGWRVRKDGSRFWADVIVTALYDSQNKLTGFAKVTRDTTEQKKARDTLTHFNEELSRQVHEKTQKLEETTLQLRQLSAHLQQAREEERKKIAREMHDELGQMLTGLKMDVVWLRKHVEHPNESIVTRFDRTLDLLSDTKNVMRRISRDLHPSVLEDLGLIAALQRQSREFEEWSGIKTTFRSNITTNIEPGISIGLYRIFQESLTNIVKHAQATEANAFLEIRDGLLVMGISDDGTGFEPELVKEKKTLGLVSMRERALMLNGTYEIHSVPGEGTTVLIKIKSNPSFN